ncbi:hypothetical protein ACE38V_04225 [Cytobacillus sp. Hz8]|uniref:hypothetical protein n=1 Tax=Cytobacillus sp. Hz8 TaxID=3347168 RepID=UPI0035D62952
MAYIIDNANLLKKEELAKLSILIKNETILAIRPEFKRYRYMKMDASPFIMTPSHILLDSQIPLEEPFPVLKEYFIKEFIGKGCTSFLTYFKVDKEYLLEEGSKMLKTKLLNSPIDYIIGVKIPQSLLTTTLIRKAKKMKIPIIFVEVHDLEQFQRIPWGWIKEALFPYNCPLAPIFSFHQQRDKIQAQAIWNKTMKKERIRAFEDELKEKTPLTLDKLKKIGIYPLKAYLNQGGEVSYNFYLNSQEIRKIEESELFHYHNNRLMITVHKGTIIRSLEDVVFRPGFGEHVTIHTPLIFSAD